MCTEDRGHCNKVAASKLRPRPKEGSVVGVVLEGGVGPPLLHGLFLQDGDATDVAEKEPDKERGQHTQVLGAPHHRGGRQPKSRPLQDLAKVVGVSAVGPKTSVDELPLLAQ